jgi:hypothetical protein
MLTLAEEQLKDKHSGPARTLNSVAFEIRSIAASPRHCERTH